MFFIHSLVNTHALHAFPTRRSSDLRRMRDLHRLRRRLQPYHTCLCTVPAGQVRLRPGVAPTQGDFGASHRGTKMAWDRSEEHTSELQSHHDLVCRLLLEKKKTQRQILSYWCLWLRCCNFRVQ